eukprot:scaffold1076_cov342-Prasinococcus_capsulatus_cf.AAC.6
MWFTIVSLVGRTCQPPSCARPLSSLRGAARLARAHAGSARGKGSGGARTTRGSSSSLLPPTEGVGDELREVGVLVARRLEPRVQLACAATAHPQQPLGPAHAASPHPLRNRSGMRARRPREDAPALPPRRTLQQLPDAIAVGADDHGAAHGAVVRQLGLADDVEVPPRKVLRQGCHALRASLAGCLLRGLALLAGRRRRRRRRRGVARARRAPRRPAGDRARGERSSHSCRL